MRVVIIISFLFFSLLSIAQEFADKEYYLVDSLVLEELSNSDKEIIEIALKNYHNANDDTSKINALNGICENMMHNDWSKYQYFQKKMIERALSTNPKGKRFIVLNKRLAGAISNIGYIHQNLGNNEKAIQYYQKALQVQLKLKDTIGMALTLNNIGSIYNYQGNLPQTITYYQQSLNLQKKMGNKKGVGLALSNIAYVYKHQGDIPNSLKYYSQALKIYEELGDDDGAGTVWNNLAMVYILNNDTDKSIECLKKAQKIYIQVGDKEGLSITMNNLGSIYIDEMKFEKALFNLYESLKLRKEIGLKRGVAATYHNIGRVYIKKNEIDTAIHYFRNSLSIWKELNNGSGIAQEMEALGRSYLLKNEIKKAFIYAKDGYSKSIEVGYPEDIGKTALLLSLVYERLSKEKEALEMFKLHIQMRDSINNEETQKAAIRQQTQYEFEKEQIRKENEAKEKARIEAEQLKRRDNLEYSLIFLGILLLFGVVLMLGFIKVSPNVAEGLIFFSFLILFEFILVFAEPYINEYTDGEPIYTLLANAAIALLIFPLHDVLESKLKKRIVKK